MSVIVACTFAWHNAGNQLYACMYVCVSVYSWFNTPTNHSHAQPWSTPNLVYYFPLKHVYVKYKNAILSHIGCSLAHETIRYMGIYFTRNFFTKAQLIVVVEAIKYLGKYMTICLILACEKEAIYILQNSILIFYINMFQRKLFTKF